MTDEELEAIRQRVQAAASVMRFNGEGTAQELAEAESDRARLVVLVDKVTTERDGMYSKAYVRGLLQAFQTLAEERDKWQERFFLTFEQGQDEIARLHGCVETLQNHLTPKAETETTRGGQAEKSPAT